MRIAYADPPYPGCAHLYRDHPDYAGEVEHSTLVDRLEIEVTYYMEGKKFRSMDPGEARRAMAE